MPTGISIKPVRTVGLLTLTPVRKIELGAATTSTQVVEPILKAVPIPVTVTPKLEFCAPLDGDTMDMLCPARESVHITHNNRSRLLLEIEFMRRLICFQLEPKHWQTDSNLRSINR